MSGNSSKNRIYVGRVWARRKGCNCTADIEEGAGFFLNLCLPHKRELRRAGTNPMGGDWSVELLEAVGHVV